MTLKASYRKAKRPAPCQVDSEKTKNNLRYYQKQFVQFVQAALLLSIGKSILK